MSGIGTGYDLSATTFSPDGRVFQVVYAGKAVENSGSVVGVRCSDGVILAVEKMILNKMLEEGSNRRVHAVSDHIGLAFAGLQADARNLVNRARSEARSYVSSYDEPIPVRILADRLSLYMQAHTLYGSVRPFGVSVVIAGTDRKGPQLFKVDPSGVFYGYFGCAAGKGKQAAQGELEKLDLKSMTCAQAVTEIAKVVHYVHDDVKDKEFELELGWACEASKHRFVRVPKDIHQAAETEAKRLLDDDEDDDDDDADMAD
eukprot:TRINITY_DN8606_c0_g1_i1.p1 TRINITY_DN8606_c0_g1~~TRINITY_DN8606_c0_g1_i1.p1  ORF type:complete len:285 (+),score=66.17 TRINITY_DN8606_c0_g1_i1:79-855(+)